MGYEETGICKTNFFHIWATPRFHKENLFLHCFQFYKKKILCNVDVACPVLVSFGILELVILSLTLVWSDLDEASDNLQSYR